MREKELITWLDGITEFSLYALIFTLPFSKSMVEIFFVVALICWVATRFIKYSHEPRATGHEPVGSIKKIKEGVSKLIRAFKPVKTDLNLPIAGFVFFAFLSTINSVSLFLSLEGFFLKLFEWVMLYFIVAETINSKRRLDRILIVIFSSMVLIGIDGIVQFITGTDVIRHYTASERIHASFRSPNSFAGWLVIMVPLALCGAYFRTNARFDKGIKSILWIIAAILIFCLAATYARGAWIAVILSLIFLSIFKTKKFLLFILIALLAFPFLAPPYLKEKICATFQPSKLMEEQRYYTWHEALDIIEDFPLLGCGLNTYATVAPDYKIAEKGGGGYPHNSYLHMAAESGLLGLGAFIWIMVTLFKASLVNLKRINDKSYNALLIGLLAGLFGFLAHSFVDSNIYTLQLGNLMWFIMGLIVATQRIALKTKID